MEGDKIDRFGQIICRLICRCQVVDSDGAVLDLVPEMVQTTVDVLGARTPLVLGCELNGANVVFKNFAMDVRLGRNDRKL